MVSWAERIGLRGDDDSATLAGRRGAAWRGEEGYVLLWALFAFILLSGFAALALKSGGSQRRMSKATASWNDSFYAAEAGLQQVIQFATDTLVGGLAPGDSVDLGWRTIAGSAQYRGVVYRIDDGPHALYLARSTGRVPGLFSGRTTTSAVFTLAANEPDALVFNRGLTIQGIMEITGGCRVHANEFLHVPGELRTDGPVSSSGTVTGNVRSDDVQQFTDSQQPSPVIPPGFCDSADYRVQDGWLVDISRADSMLLGSSGSGDWERTGAREYRAEAMAEGIYCVDGSLTVEDMGSPGSSERISIAAQGFVKFVDNPYIEAAHDTDILIAAEGDVSLHGEKHPNNPNYKGEIRAGSQCGLVSRPWVQGAMSCLGNPDPPGVRSIVTDNTIVGNLELTTRCNVGGPPVPRPIRARAWQHEY